MSEWPFFTVSVFLELSVLLRLFCPCAGNLSKSRVWACQGLVGTGACKTLLCGLISVVDLFIGVSLVWNPVESRQSSSDSPLALPGQAPQGSFRAQEARVEQQNLMANVAKEYAVSPVEGEASGRREGSFLVSPGKLAMGTALTPCRYIAREDQARLVLQGEDPGICRKKKGDLQVNGLRAKTEVGTIGYAC